MPAAIASASFQNQHPRGPVECGRDGAAEMKSLDMLQVRRFLDDTVADDAGEPHANGADRLAPGQRANLGADGFGDLLGRQRLQSSGDARIRRIQTDRSSEPVVLDQPHCDVLHRENAEGMSHHASAERSRSRQFVQAVERRGLVTFGQRRIVEDGIDEVVDGVVVT